MEFSPRNRVWELEETENLEKLDVKKLDLETRQGQARLKDRIAWIQTSRGS